MPIYTVQGPDGKTYEIEGPAGATAEQLGAVISSQGAQPQPAEPPPSFGQMFKREVLNSVPVQAGLGAVRGAGSIGATLLRPFESGAENEQRRQAMTGGLQEMGANPDSVAFGAGKLGGEIAGTAGVGSALAAPFRGIPAVQTLLQSGGMATGMPAAKTMGAKAAELLMRTGAGAAVGGASAGLVNPEDAGLGAVIGGVAPTAIKAAGALGDRVGANMNAKMAEELKRYAQNAPKNETIERALKAGYIIPPASVDPTMKNRVLESVSGKLATQQLASTRNAEVTADLLRKGLGMADDAPLNRKALEAIRAESAEPYRALAALPVKQEVRASSLLNEPGSAAFKPAQALEELKQSRNDAQAWFKAYNRSASPEDLAKARAATAQATNLENQFEKYAGSMGREDLLPALREARKQIAKTYTVERALNEASGSVDARVLARLYEKGTPLTDELETVGRFASAFPTVSKTAQQIGSPDAHNLRSMAALLMGGGGAAAAGPAGLAAAAVPFVAPPLARKAMFSKGAQQALIQQAPKNSNAAMLANMLRNPELLEAVGRASPVIGASAQ